MAQNAVYNVLAIRISTSLFNIQKKCFHEKRLKSERERKENNGQSNKLGEATPVGLLCQVNVHNKCIYLYLYTGLSKLNPNPIQL